MKKWKENICEETSKIPKKPLKKLLRSSDKDHMHESDKNLRKKCEEVRVILLSVYFIIKQKFQKIICITDPKIIWGI